VSLELSVFQANVGQSFKVCGFENQEELATLALSEATSLPHASEKCKEPFSLIFEGPDSTPLDQGTYVFEHSSIGAQPIFMVPLSQSNGMRRYQAIFN